ncbi:MAG: hypothetical protein GOVbin1096_99 [Prokaryotic dsDNA virus sp.]|jgi:hypothetical protein|nr:MAG: hypothetical protein GOVbin1096_99 [Prokaryotic dsDNA virus sp.]|tara:strand:+ start:21385 stop:21624 length:240 start_codon:yes stop_codon:yes gene_type:complete
MAKRITVGTYVGDIEKLKGHTALIRYDEDNNILAQFDDMQLRYHGRGMGFGWHKFDSSDFKIRKKNDKGESCRLPEDER